MLFEPEGSAVLSHVRARLAALVDPHSTLPPLARAKALCGLGAQTTGADGVGLSVASVQLSGVISTVCATDALSVRLEELQLGLGEGPTVDVLQTTLPVLAPDLGDVSHPRWLWFGPAAADAGAAAVFVLPLWMNERRLGALSLYRRTSGDLTAEEFDDFRVHADAATMILLEDNADSGGLPGAWTVGEDTGFRPEFYQAVGVIMTQLEVDAEHALARLRGHAYATGQSISAVSHEVVSGCLRLDESDTT